MPLIPVQLRPGVNRDTTSYSNEGGYFACDKIRFRSGFPEKIGGWERYNIATFLGAARGLFNWVTLDANNLMAIGTNQKYYIENSGGFFDITPLRTTTTLGANPLSTTSGSKTVTVTFVGHGARLGDFVTFSGASAVGGIPAADINREQVVTAFTPNTYTFEVATAATSTATGGGAAVVAAYQLPVGPDIAVPGFGWGAGPWGRDNWSGPASSGTFSVLRLWSQDNFGDAHVFCERDREIYYWEPVFSPQASRAVRLRDVAGTREVPLMAAHILMSQTDRHLIAFGCNPVGSTEQDPLLVRWCSSEDIGDWLPTIENTSGDLRIGSGNKIVTAVRTRQEIIIFTDAGLHSMQFIGAPDTFGILPAAENISIISPRAATVVNNTIYWMGVDKFYSYSGRVDTVPCTLQAHVFKNINLGQGVQVHAGTNEGFNEVWWFYCTKDSLTIDAYVIYNYVDRTWYYGSLHRTAWLDSPTKQSPVAAGNNLLYSHEVGVDDVNLPLPAFIETSDFDIDTGEYFSFVTKMIPDVTFRGSVAPAPQVQITLTPRNHPGGAYFNNQPSTVSKTVTVEQFTEKCDVRLRGRQVKMRVESDALGVQWQLGTPRIMVQPDGQK